MKILITGVAGFIGSHLAETLLKMNYEIIGLDNLNDYYDIKIKENNLKLLTKYKNFTFLKEDIVNTTSVERYKPNLVCNLASLAGVRNSIENPISYIDNIKGHVNLMQQCVDNNKINYIYASSSSVYGLNKKFLLKNLIF